MDGIAEGRIHLVVDAPIKEFFGGYCCTLPLASVHGVAERLGAITRLLSQVIESLSELCALVITREGAANWRAFPCERAQALLPFNIVAVV